MGPFSRAIFRTTFTVRLTSTPPASGGPAAARSTGWDWKTYTGDARKKPSKCKI